jgi:hypothetical protein
MSQIFFCYSILTLSLSSSNSGILNLISLGICFAIDQVAVRGCLGLIGVSVMMIAGVKTQENQKLFQENSRLMTFCGN